MGERLWIIESTTVGDGKLEQKLLPDHLKHQLELERTGVLFAAGPAIDIGTKKRVGIIIIRAASAEEADLIAKNDPMHAGGGRTYRIMQWMLNEGGFTMTMRFATGDYDFK